MDLVWIAAAVTILALVSLIGYLGPGALMIYWVLLKAGWKFLAPIWVVLKQKKWYKVGAIFLTFGSFLLYFYTFMKTGDTSLLNAATDALAATINGSLEELKQSGQVLIGPKGLGKKAFALFLAAASFAKIYLYLVGWKMLKKRVPELTFYLLIGFSFYLLTWGSTDANALFEVFDFAGTAADQAANNPMINTTSGG